MSIIKILDTAIYLKRFTVTYYTVTVSVMSEGEGSEGDNWDYYIVDENQTCYSNVSNHGGGVYSFSVPSGTTLTIIDQSKGNGRISVNGSDFSKNEERDFIVNSDLILDIFGMLPIPEEPDIPEEPEDIYYSVTVEETTVGLDPGDGSCYSYEITYANGDMWLGEDVLADTVLVVSAMCDGEGFVRVNGEDISGGSSVAITISARTVIKIECGYYEPPIIDYTLTLHYNGESRCSFVLLVDGTEWAQEDNIGTYQYYIPEDASVSFEIYPDGDYTYTLSENNFIMSGPKEIYLDCWYAGVSEPEGATLIIEPYMFSHESHFDFGLQRARFEVISNGPYFVDGVTLGFAGNINGDNDQVGWYAGDTVSIKLLEGCNTGYWSVDTGGLTSITLSPGENRVFIPCTFIQ